MIYHYFGDTEISIVDAFTVSSKEQNPHPMYVLVHLRTLRNPLHAIHKIDSPRSTPTELFLLVV